MKITYHVIDLEDFKRFCQKYHVINGTYLQAYLQTKAPTLEVWIEENKEADENE